MRAEDRFFLGRRDRGAYADPCARVRALEKRLLGKERLGELRAAESVADVTAMLRSWGWLSMKAEENGGWDEAVTLSLAESDRELVRMDPSPLVTSLMVSAHDLLNLCVVLKAKAGKRPFDGRLHPRGRHSASVLESMVNRMEFAGFPDVLAAGLARLGEVLVAGSPAGITGAVFRARHEALRETARREGSRLLLDFLDHSADLANIVFRIRSALYPELWSGGKLFLPPGLIAEEIIGGAADVEELARRLGRTVYGPLLERSRDEDGRISPVALEREGENLLTEILQPARYVSLGPEPLWSYYFARETDARNIRSIILGLLSGRGSPVLRRPHV
jgi:V/A-type H+-transporting ATPase subunit C